MLLDRARLEKVALQVKRGEELSGEDAAWLTDLARAYRVIEKEDTVVGEKEIAELRVRVDLVPLSLAPSQAAEENGWGTSRFAAGQRSGREVAVPPTGDKVAVEPPEREL